MSNVQDIKFSVEPKLVEDGIRVKMATFFVPQIAKHRTGRLKKYINEIISHLNITTMLTSPMLAEYKKFYTAVDIKGTPPAEYLLRLIEKSNMLPNINKVVDCYNIVSAETLLSIGAHDLAYIKGNIKFKYTDGTEKYTPLGKTELEKVTQGEYACMDDEKILCRMDLKQCDETKVGENTRKFIVYIQGNKATTEEYVSRALDKVCRNISEFCDGEYKIL